MGSITSKLDKVSNRISEIEDNGREILHEHIDKEKPNVTTMVKNSGT